LGQKKSAFLTIFNSKVIDSTWWSFQGVTRHNYNHTHCRTQDQRQGLGRNTTVLRKKELSTLAFSWPFLALLA